MAQRSAKQPFGCWPRNATLDLRTADIKKLVVLHSRRTRGFAVSATEASVEMKLRLRSDRLPLEHLFDQIYAPARTVEFITKQLIGRTRCIAEPAMYAGAENARRFICALELLCFFAEIRLHRITRLAVVQISAYMRPGLMMPWGSSCSFN
ncbi:hypothetical protein LMG28727_07040 [Paraburkholderia kirstenboschensis]|nr:hypothetical protein LMG28727_07040 [Paraburkholderia kirstenboschensis]